MKERILKLLPRLLYPAVYLLSFPICLSLTFPYEYVRDLIVSGFNTKSASTGGRDELRIDSVSGYWLSGIEMKGVRLVSAPSDPSSAPTEWDAERVAGRVSLLPLLIGHKTVNFSVEAYGGTIDGSFTQHGTDLSLDVDLSAVDLAKVGAVADALGVPMTGTVSGNIKLEVPDGKMHKSSGAMKLTIDAMTVGDGKAKLKGALALPKVNVGPVAFEGEIRDGNVRVSKLGTSGKDVELAGDGKIALRENPTDSLVDMNVRFKINDAYRTRSEVATSLFGAPGSTVPALFELADPRVKQSKRADGFYGWTVRGPLSRLDFMAAGGSAGAAAGSPR